MILSELIARIQELAGPDAVNADVSIEILLPRVLNKLVADACKDENQLEALRSNHTITFTSGTGTLPATIKEEYVEAMTVPATPTASYRKTAFDYSADNTLFDVFYVNSGNIYYKSAGGTALTGSKTFSAITLPVLPAASTDTVVLKANLLEQVITYTASILRGEPAPGLDNA